MYRLWHQGRIRSDLIYPDVRTFLTHVFPIWIMSSTGRVVSRFGGWISDLRWEEP